MLAPWPGARCLLHCSLQNGAFWATPLSYVAPALVATGHAAVAEALLVECIDDFKRNGIYEDVADRAGGRAGEGGHGQGQEGREGQGHGVLNYTASATNVLWAAKFVRAHRHLL